MINLQIISTGGTFNKIYNESNGLFDIDDGAIAPRKIVSLARGNILCKHTPIIHKDSNYFTDEDRLLLLNTVKESEHSDIIIIHGTDTMHISAEYLANNLINNQKRVVFVGAMKPYNVQKDEPIFNLAAAIGFLNSTSPNNIYISMHGLVLKYDLIKKNREHGVFQAI